MSTLSLRQNFLWQNSVVHTHDTTAPMFDLSECRLYDAEIVRVESTVDSLTIIYRDWQEQERRLLFRNVVGFESFSPEQRALSHATIDDHDPFIAKACALAEEDSTSEFHAYSFVSAWKNTKVLRIVAKQVLQLA